MMRTADLTAVFIVIISVTLSFASITVPYLNDMELGKTFDYSQSKVGNVDLLNDDIREKAIESRHDMSYMKFKMINDQKDIRDVLDISGELSVKIMLGRVNIAGKGKYLKSSVNNEDTVDVLVQIYYRTVTETITDDIMISAIKNNGGWKQAVSHERHYIRSITYGGYLVASLKCTAKENKNVEDIQAAVELDVKTAKLDVGVKGQFKKLWESAEDVSELKASFSSSVMPDGKTSDLDGILEAIAGFPKQVKERNEGRGSAIEVELRELMYLPNSDNLDFMKSDMLNAQMDKFASMFAELTMLLPAIKEALDVETSERHETVYGKFSRMINKIIDVFTETADKLDINDVAGSSDEFNKAFKAYLGKETGFLPGKYSRQFTRIQKKLPILRLGVSVLRKNKEKEKMRKMKKNLKKETKKLNKKMAELESTFSGDEVKISFSLQRKIGDTLTIVKGSPEMDSFMICLSANLGKDVKDYTDELQIVYITAVFFIQISLFPVSKEATFRIFDHGRTTLKRFKVDLNDGRWHAYCFYWDNSGTMQMYEDGTEIVKKKLSDNEKNLGYDIGYTGKLIGGGKWKINYLCDILIPNLNTFEITNVNIYGNFELQYFQKTVAPVVSSNICQPKINDNLIISWDQFKMEFVGNYTRALKRSSF